MKLSASNPRLNPQQLADALQVKPSWVYSRTRTSHLTGFPVTRCGKYCRFDLVRVLDWLENQDNKLNGDKE